MDAFIAKILAFFNGIFHTPVLTELFIAVLPIVELRGAIPIGVESGLPIWLAGLIGFAGSSLPSPIILLALIPALNALKKTKGFKRFAGWIENKFRKKSDKLEDKADRETGLEAGAPAVEKQNSSPAQLKRRERIKLLGLYAFVAVPLPFTGVWTGSAVAAFMGINFWKALGTVLLGNLTAALIITFVTYLFKDYLWAVILILFGIIILIILCSIIIALIKKGLRKKAPQKDNADNSAAVIVTDGAQPEGLAGTETMTVLTTDDALCAAAFGSEKSPDGGAAAAETAAGKGAVIKETAETDNAD